MSSADNSKGTTAVAFDKLHDRYGDLLVEHGYAVKALRTILNVIRLKLHEAAKRAGVLTRTAPHQLRHALAVELARDGTPVPLVSRQLGHSNVATTATYLTGIAPEEVIAVMAGRTW